MDVLVVLVAAISLVGCTGVKPQGESAPVDAPESAPEIAKQVVDAAHPGDMWFGLSIRSPGPVRGTSDNVYGFESATVCLRSRRPNLGVGAAFYFRPGSTELVRVNASSLECSTGKYAQPSLAECREQKLVAKALSGEDFVGRTVHGYVWPGETKNESQATQLSRRRLEVVREWLSGEQLAEIGDWRAHGTAWTNTSPESSSQLLGAYIEVADWIPAPREQLLIGPPLSFSTYRDLLTFVEETDYGGAVFDGTWVSVKYRPPLSETDGAADQSAQKLLRHFDSAGGSVASGTGASELLGWSLRMFDSNCDVSKVGLPGEPRQDEQTAE